MGINSSPHLNLLQICSGCFAAKKTLSPSFRKLKHSVQRLDIGISYKILIMITLNKWLIQIIQTNFS